MKNNSLDRNLLQILAPKGYLRVAINLGNEVLAQKDPHSGVLSGITVKLASKLAVELNLDIRFIEYKAAGKVVNASQKDEWDIAFLAIDPLRAKSILFTKPYIIIEGAYMVRKSSTLKHANEVDKNGTQIVVGKDAAYDLYLTRNLKEAEILRAPTTTLAPSLFLEQNIEVLAGIKGPLIDLASESSDLRVLDGIFMEIKQAMALPLKSHEVKHIVDEFIEEIIKSQIIN